VSIARDSGGRFTAAPRKGSLWTVADPSSNNVGAIVKIDGQPTRNGYVPVILIGTMDTPREQWGRRAYRADLLNPYG
jgi:hypothetical protein